jgi:hypothetical protein
MAAIPFIDVVAFNNEPTLRTIFHSLVHVTQFSVVGLETVMEGYFRALNESGLWMVVPFEEQAYQLDGRYTRNAADVFSVEDEVREWHRSGRFIKEEKNTGLCNRGLKQAKTEYTNCTLQSKAAPLDGTFPP